MHEIDPLSKIRQVFTSPTDTSMTVRPGGKSTCFGVLDFGVEPCTSPQQYSEPFVRMAHVAPGPFETVETAASNPKSTHTGVLTYEVQFPTPSCPSLFWPQHISDWFCRMMQAFWVPVEIWRLPNTVEAALALVDEV